MLHFLNLIKHDIVLTLLNMETVLADANFPASTAYIDISPYERFGFLIFAGTVDTALTFQVLQDTSATETADVKNITGAVVIVPALGDDKWYAIEVQAARLDLEPGATTTPDLFKYVTLKLTGAAGTNDYACIVFYGIPYTSPATQPNLGEAVSVVG